jgi:hypothetical protein
MQSDALDRIGELFSPATAAFRSAATDAIEQVRGYRDAHARPTGSPATRAAAELGIFAAGHIDEERFAALFTSNGVFDPDTLRLLDRALAVLQELSNREGPAFRAEVGPGGDVAATVGSALASIGRVFGAARGAELVRLGRIEEARKEDAAAPFPFVRWTTAERRMGPPLLVSCAGSDLDAAGLAPFLDGTQKIVLLVEGASPAAALARLITPGTFVMQTDDAESIARVAAFDGPGIAALVPEGGMAFAHDPSAPRNGRLVVGAKPVSKPRATRAASVFQQQQSLALLEVFERAFAESAVATVGAGASPATGAAAGATGSTAPSATPVVADPADRLAAWLLAQADLQPAGALER